EDYLKAIFELETRNGAASTNEIAAALRIAAPSVSGMIRRLSSQGLITHEPYKGVQLTRDGRRAALKTIRRHRVIEAYLTLALGAEVELVSREPYDGPITVKVDGRRRVIGGELARQILVEPKRKSRG